MDTENQKRIRAKSAEALQFFGGVPTAIDIDAIRKRYPDTELKVGDLIPYATIEQIIGCKKLSCRFRTVTSRWRKLAEKEFGIVIGTISGEGFVVLSPHERVDLSASKLRQAFKFGRRGGQIAIAVPAAELTNEDLRRKDHFVGISSAILAQKALLSRKVTAVSENA